MSAKPKFKKKRVKEEAKFKEPEEEAIYTEGAEFSDFLKGFVGWIVVSVTLQLILRLALPPNGYDPSGMRALLQMFMMPVLCLSNIIAAAALGSKHRWTGIGIFAGLFINLTLVSRLFSGG